MSNRFAPLGFFVFHKFRVLLYFFIVTFFSYFMATGFYYQATLVGIEVSQEMDQSSSDSDEDLQVDQEEVVDDDESLGEIQYLSRYGQAISDKPWVPLIELSLYLLIFLILFIYVMPISKVLAEGYETVDKDLREKSKNHIVNLSWKTFSLCWVLAVLFFINQYVFEKLHFNLISLGETLLMAATWFSFGLSTSSLIIAIYDVHIIDFFVYLFPANEMKHARTDASSVNLTTRVISLILAICVLPLILLLFQSSTTVLMSDFWTQILAGTGREYLFDYYEDLTPILYGMCLILFSLLSALILGRSLIRSLFEPLTSMVRRMEKVKKGDFDAHANVYNNNEFGKLSANFNKMVDGLKESHKMMENVDKFLSAEVRESVLVEDVNLGGEEVEATVLFCDIRSFTTISEEMPPTELVAFLNEFFSYLVKPITDNKGVVNKYIGDCIMALFGVPNRTSDHSDNALKAIVGMRKALAVLNHRRTQKGLPTISIGVGIHSGTLVAGNIGDKTRMEYTVIGDTVNVAARIESETKAQKTDLLISEDVKNSLSESYREIEFVSVPGIHVKGRAKPVNLYKILDKDLSAISEEVKVKDENEVPSYEDFMDEQG
ncbi:MAG: adenylate/guanylate cyclase domain-containing protein [Candidatus Cloacimonetes bacterium]|nr:adenylate/guanylate cyclase domain-containing protein [Candidatus Cloacimonadota bacterium]